MRRTPRRLTDDRQHRLVIHLGVVESVQQMDGPGPGGGETDPDLTGELGMPPGHERRHLLVAHLDELRIALGAIQRTHDPVDAVAGVSEDPMNAPSPKALSRKSLTVSAMVPTPVGTVTTFKSPHRHDRDPPHRSLRPQSVS
jgi:hypothetical protein